MESLIVARALGGQEQDFKISPPKKPATELIQ